MEYTLTTARIQSLRTWADMLKSTPPPERFWVNMHDDVLFWCFYVCRFGINAYVMSTITKSDASAAETTGKTACARDLAENKEMRARVKSLKLDTLKHTAQQLSPCEQLSLQTFFCVCAMYDIYPWVIYEGVDGIPSTVYLPNTTTPTDYLYITNQGCACIVDANDVIIQEAKTRMIPIQKASATARTSLRN